MTQSESTKIEELARVATDFQTELTGHAPRAVSVVLSDDTLVIRLHEALTPAEKALAGSPAGAAKIQDFHRQLFASSAERAGAGNQANHGARRVRVRCRVGARHRRGRACLHDRHHRANIRFIP